MKFVQKQIVLLLFVLFMAGIQAAFAQNKEEKPKTTRILFLLDASGSMKAKFENTQRWPVAKSLLSQLVDSLDKYPNLELGLRVYGHQSPNSRNDCRDTKLEVPFSDQNSEEIQKKLKQLVPQGNTPITYSMEQSANDFPNDPNARNIIIIITDGLESCGGDPCATSLALQRKRIFLKPFIIGLGTDPGFEKQFSCMGQYYNAADIKTFRSVLDNVVTLALSKTTVSVEIVDDNNKPIESNVNMTFLNNVTGIPEYNYVHYYSPENKPDILEIDAVLNYDLVINTLPKVVEQNLRIIPGKHNVIKVKAPQGVLHLRQDGPTPYGKVEAIVREDNNRSTLYAQTFGSKQKYLTGKYDLEILTLPRIYMKDVVVKQGQPTTITFPPAGILSISSELQGYGSIYTIDENGQQQWIYNLPEENSKIALPLQPGRYRLVYRMKTASSSKFTDVQNFTIKSGATTSLKIFNR